MLRFTSLERCNIWFIENSVELHLTVKFLRAAPMTLKKFEIRLLNQFHDQDLDLLMSALAENKVLELVEIDGIHLHNKDIETISQNKQPGF